MLISNKVKVLWTHLHKYFYDCNKYFRSSSLFQFSSVTQSCPTLCVPMDCSTQASLSITNSQSLLKLMSIKSVMPSNHLILCHPLFRLSSVFSTIRVFSNESALHIRWPSIGASASASVLPVNIQDWFPFKIDCLDLLAVPGTLKNLLQHHSWKASILRCQKHQC